MNLRMKHVILRCLAIGLLAALCFLTACGTADTPTDPTHRGEGTTDDGGTTAPDEPTPRTTSVVFNEVCSKNDAYPAPDGGYYDYIELYNPADTAESLGGWSLSDGKKNLRKFVFPEGTTIPAGGYLLVYADGVGNDAGARDGWYAAFKISNDGEDLHLADPDGRLSVSLRVPALRKNESYGRAADGGEAFATLTPTPGASNDGSALTIAASVLSFSHESGFYADPFSLSVTAPDGYRVYYTTDCSDPAVSATRLRLADGESVPVSDPSGALRASADYFAALGKASDTSYVDQCFVLRVCAESADGTPTETVTKTYFVGKNGRTDLLGLPVVLLTTDAASVYGDAGLFADYRNQNREERVNLTLLHPDGTYWFDQAAGISIRGSSTRNAPQKTLNVIARAEYDGNARMLGDLFPEATYTKSFVLRADNMSRGLVGQGMIQDFARGLEITTQDSFYVTVFLDGEYFGLYNLYERVNEHFLEAHYGVDRRNTEIVKFGREGTASALADYRAAMNLLNTADLSDPAELAALEARLDLDSLIDLWCVQMYIDNGDFSMMQNISAWRVTDPTAESPTNPYADGRWRFVIFDLDYALCGNLTSHKDAYTRDTFTAKPKNAAIGAPFCEWKPVANLMRSPEMRLRFGRAFLKVTECYDYETIVKPRFEKDVATLKAHGAIYIKRYNAFTSTGAVRTESAFDTYSVYQKKFFQYRKTNILGYLYAYLGVTEDALRDGGTR